MYDAAFTFLKKHWAESEDFNGLAKKSSLEANDDQCEWCSIHIQPSRDP